MRVKTEAKRFCAVSWVLLLWKTITDGALPQPFLNFVATKGTIWISGKALYGLVWVICQHMQAIKCVKFLVCKVGCKCKEVWHLWLCSTLRSILTFMNMFDMPFGSSCAALKLKTLHFDALVIVIWHQFKAPYYEVAQLLPAWGIIDMMLPPLPVVYGNHRWLVILATW